MNAFAMLLRLLLCASLILNGSGVAQASARMPSGHAAHVSVSTVPSTATVDRAGMPPCHRDAAEATPSTLVHGGPAIAHAAASEAQPASAADGKAPVDCCKGKSCACACAHVSCAAMVSLVMPVVPMHDMRVQAPAVDHPHPRLRHLIRPPIG